jgi:hypothetical protein
MKLCWCDDGGGGFVGRKADVHLVAAAKPTSKEQAQPVLPSC